jgi:hypothetical protein
MQRPRQVCAILRSSSVTAAGFARSFVAALSLALPIGLAAVATGLSAAPAVADGDGGARGGPRDGAPKSGPRDGAAKAGPGDGAPKVGPRDGAAKAGPKDGAPKAGTRDGEGVPKVGPRDGEAAAKGGPRDGAPKAGMRDGEGKPRTGPRDGDARPAAAAAPGDRKQRRIFDAYDKDHDGLVSFAEWLAMKEGAAADPDRQARELQAFSRADSDGDAKLTFDEFGTVLARPAGDEGRKASDEGRKPAAGDGDAPRRLKSGDRE